MTAVEVFNTVMLKCWDLLSFEVPGLDGVTGKQFVAAQFLMLLAVAAVQLALGFGQGSYRSGQSGKKHISKERKNDEK